MKEQSENSPNRIIIKHKIIANDHHTLNYGLGDDQSVERVTVKQGQLSIFNHVLAANVKGEKSANQMMDCVSMITFITYMH